MNIKLGTLFSGIGSVEFALKRMKLEHEIIFACDNGDVVVEFDEGEKTKIWEFTDWKKQNEYIKEIFSKKSRKQNYVEKSYLANYKIDPNRFFYDVKMFNGKLFKDKINFLMGGSPCQSFSAIGHRRGLEDARGTLFYEYARVIMETQPSVFIYENVFGMLTHDKGNTWKVIKEIFESLGYFFKFKVINSKEHGIPQSRRRLFVVGFKEKKYFDLFDFPKPLELKLKMSDMLENNINYPNLTSGKNGELIFDYVSNDKNFKIDNKYYLSDKLKKYVLSPGTKNFYHANAKIDLDIARSILSTVANSHRSSINNYVTDEFGIRRLTPRECHRLMGYTDDYIFVNSNSQLWKQAGNSIVVDVTMDLIKEIVNTGVFENDEV